MATAKWPIPDRPIRVGIVATTNSPALDFVGPHEIFSLAKHQLLELGDERGRGYEVQVLKIGKGRLLTGITGLSILCSGSYRNLKGTIDTLLVVGGTEPNFVGKEPILDWLRNGQLKSEG